MFLAYSPDLRERIAAASQQPGRTVGAVAAQFSVSVSFVAKLLQHQRGSLAALPHRSGPALCLDAPEWVQLGPVCSSNRTLCSTNRASGWWPSGRHREPGHAGSDCGGAGLVAKKKSVLAAECETEWVRALRAAFVEAVQTEDFTRFKFVDETSTNLTYGRCYARVEGRAAYPHGGPNMTRVAVLTPDGLQAAMTVSGAVSGDVFAASLD